MNEIHYSAPFSGILELKDKFAPIDLFFTDKKVVINDVVYADFAKPVLFPDMDYILKHLHKDVETITYTTGFEAKPLPKEEEVIFLFDPLFYCTEEHLKDKHFVIQINTGILVFKDYMYLCLGLGKQKVPGALQRLFVSNLINRRLIDSCANWFVIMNSIHTAVTEGEY